MRQICLESVRRSTKGLASAAALVVAATVAAPAANAQMDVVTADLVKVIARTDGVLEALPFEFEGCITGTGITSGTLTIPTTPTPTVTGFSPSPGGEFCVSGSFATSGALDTAFPNGTYIFDFTDGPTSDQFSLVLSESAPAAFLDFISPTDGETGVPIGSGLTLQWTIVENPPGSGCAATMSCGDGIVVDVIRLSDDADVLDVLLGAGATTVTAPAGTENLDGLTLFESEIVIFNGSDRAQETSDLLADRFSASFGYADVNLIEFTTAALPLDLEEVGVFKFVDRVDGALIVDPYGFEACVIGTGIVSATVTPPAASAIPLLFEGENEWCTFQSFADAAALALAFPNGLYAFAVTAQADSDSKTLDLQAAEPGAFLDIVAPLDGATVPVDQDLNYSWALTEKPNGVGCIVGASCADNLFIDVEESLGMTLTLIVESLFAVGTTSTLIPAASLNAGADYEAEIETLNGLIDDNALTDQADPILALALYEDINFVTFVPEPTAGAAAAAALLTLSLLRRRRRPGRGGSL